MSSLRGLSGAFVQLAAAVALAACAEPAPRSSPAVPIATFGGQNPGPKWAGPGDPTCHFPPDAQAAKVNAAAVVVRVLVEPDGAPGAVQLLEDPGYGFGNEAVRCVGARRFEPERDAQGTAVRGWTTPIRINFLR